MLSKMKVEVPLTVQHSNKSFQQVLAIRYRDITRTKICEYRRHIGTTMATTLQCAVQRFRNWDGCWCCWLLFLLVVEFSLTLNRGALIIGLVCERNFRKVFNILSEIWRIRIMLPRLHHCLPLCRYSNLKTHRDFRYRVQTLTYESRRAFCII